MPERSDLLICIPTYNEAENIEVLFRSIQQLNLNADILFLDDNSPDGTGQIAEKIATENPNVCVLHRPGKLGIGSAHLTGIRWAREHGYRLLLTMDCDFTHSPERITDFLSHSDEYDVVIGSRYLQPGSLRTWNYLRKFLTHFGHFLTTTFLKMPHDATGAFRLYRLDRISPSLFDAVQSRSYSFFFESLYILWLNKASIKEIPLELPARTYGHSKMVWRDALRSATLLLYLYLRTKIDRESFLASEPFVSNSNLPPTQVQRDWDVYWLAKQEPGTLLYDLIAVFYRKFIIKRILSHFIRKHFRKGTGLLHAGCGSGQVDASIANYVSISALDISIPALTMYRKFQPNAVEHIHASIFDIPKPDQSYDGIYNLGVMEHFTEEEIRAILREFHRVLKKDGTIILFWPPSYGITVKVLSMAHWLLRRMGKGHVKLHPDEITHVRSRSQVGKYLNDCGFTLSEFYFGIRDCFTQAVVVGKRLDDRSTIDRSSEIAVRTSA